jgi:hypothetical protein
MFARGQYDEAVNNFLELETNPAKVVALYPEAVSGRLYVPGNEWISLFGGKKTPLRKASGSVDSHTADASETAATDAGTSGGDIATDHATVDASEPDALHASAAEAATAPPEMSATGDVAPNPGTLR